MALAWILFDWGGTLMSEDGPLDAPMELWPEVRAIEGAAEVLQALAQRHRIALATNATGSDGAAIRKALRRVGLDTSVSEIFCFRELGLRKSDARFWDAVVARLGVSRAEILMVGDDLENDVLAPSRAGIASVWFNPARAPGPAGTTAIAWLEELPALIASYDSRRAMKISSEDPRYRAVVDKRFNKRFSARPDYVRLASSTAEVVSAVQDAVTEGRRLVVTSGGHCLEGFVADPEVRVILDVSPMKRIYYDAERRAVAVEAGATVGETFRAMYERWGVVVPLGEYPEIGMGGHVAGGAFGFLCRQLGLAADYLYAVEVVTVDANGRARSDVATCEPSDPNRDLWWAHTGAGGGNFGVVTRYWFRSPGASGNDPATLLPRAPESITTFKAEWSWSDVDRASFLRLLRNHGDWCERNAGADSPNASLWTLLQLPRKALGTLIARGLSTAGAGAERQIDDHLAALGAGFRAPVKRELSRMSWLDFALNPFPDLFATPPGGVSSKVKDALLRKALTDRQFGVVHDWLTRTDYEVMGGMFALATYGGRINTVPRDATASSQRGAIFDMACSAGWMDPNDETPHLAWARGFYRDLFAETGGVPVPGEAYDGCFINHPDTDVADPAFNASGVPWHALYYGENYPRLQRVKAQWDPRNVFRHALSIQSAGRR